MKLMNTAMVLLFVVSMALQYDHPEPLIWIAVYGAAAGLCVMFAIGKFPTVVGSVFAAGCLIASLILFWKLLRSELPFGGDVFNEACGLVVVFLWISTLAWTAIREDSLVT